jgi:hypothetical protein
VGNQLARISVRSAVIVLAGILAGVAGLKADAPVYSERVEQWGVQELTLRSLQTYNNPFADVNVQGLFRSGDREVVVDGFCDGDSIWRIRFMPESRGSWRFTTVSSDSDLAGKSGSFVVVAPGPGNHGLVSIISRTRMERRTSLSARRYTTG